MTVVASGSLSLPFAKAAELVAATAAFQALCGVETAAEALPRIAYPQWEIGQALKDSPETAFPRAVLWKHRGVTSHSRERIGRESGSLILSLYAAIPAEFDGDERNDLLDWSNIVGAILDQMTDLADSVIPNAPGDGAWYWHMTRYDELEPPTWMDVVKTSITCRMATYRLHWV